MVHIVKRARKLQELLWIRWGPGALILPKEVTKISLEFNKKLYGGHRGARKFWREMLPRIKFRNPSVPIQLTRHNEAEGPSLLHVFTHSKANTNTTPPTTAQSPSATASAQATATEPTHTLNIRDLQESEILEALVKTVGATELETPESEAEAIRDLAEQRKRSDADRLLVRESLLKVRREEQMLKMARGVSADNADAN